MTHTSLLRAIPATNKACEVCGRVAVTRTFDCELNGRVCDDCAPFLMHADYLLGAMPMLFSRPEQPWSTRN